MKEGKQNSSRKLANSTILKLLLAALILIILAGCASFRSSRRVNLMPFTENTLAIAGEIKAGIAEARPIYIGDHIKGPEVENYRREWKKVRRIWRAIIAYSIEIVTISESRLSEPEKGQALAEFIEDLKTAAFAYPWPELKWTEEELQEIIENIRAQEKFLDALYAAQPIIDEIVQLTDYVTEKLLDMQLRVAEEVTASIKEEHAGLLEYTALLKKAKYNLFSNIVRLGQYRMGDTTVLDEMFELDPSLLEVVSSPDSITTEDLLAIEKRMFDKVTAFEMLQKQFDPDMELYQKQMRELEDLISIAEATVGRVRVATIVWARTHRKMAAGITDPAKINVMGMAKQAISTALPVP